MSVTITKKLLEPSREDAVRLTRTEKMAMIVLAYVATVFDDMQTELGDRLKMIEDGEGRIRAMAYGSDELLHDLRATIPVEQRMNLQNTAKDHEMRLVPKMTPTTTNVIMGKEEFRELVDFARVKCRECILDDQECKTCGLYKLLTSLLPLDDYHNGLLCPYNMGEWGN